jgi:hypothetical protein
MRRSFTGSQMLKAGSCIACPCDHMVVGTWQGEVVTYGPEHALTGQAQPARDHHHHFMDDLDRILDEKVHEK